MHRLRISGVNHAINLKSCRSPVIPIRASGNVAPPNTRFTGAARRLSKEQSGCAAFGATAS
jgi:hypothetical protein